jgi:hypothetical protein
MNLDLDSGGALATAALVAHEIDPKKAPARQGAQAADAAHTGPCANCGAQLTGPYCHRCGQSAHVHHSLLHLGEEFLHGLLHFDTKAWRTLPLLVVQPGRLTRNYIDGKRTSYVSPLALFLFMVFLMFFVVSSVLHAPHVGGIPNAKGSIEQDVAKARVKLAAAEAKLEQARAAGQNVTIAATGVEVARASVRDTEEAMAMVSGGDDSLEKVVKKISEKDVKVDTGLPRVDSAIRFAMANPQFSLYKLKNAASKYSFMLVPISLPFLWLMFFWKRGITMYDHAVFALYGLSFMALLVIVASLMSAVGLSSATSFLLLLAPPFHMYIQLRGAYRLSAGSALWRTVVLLFVALTVITLYLLLILTVSLA